jgi:hypothetical protein
VTRGPKSLIVGMGNSASGSVQRFNNKKVSKDYSSSTTTNGTCRKKS